VISPLLPTYNRADIEFERGEGPYLLPDGESVTSTLAPELPSALSATRILIWLQHCRTNPRSFGTRPIFIASPVRSDLGGGW